MSEEVFEYADYRDFLRSRTRTDGSRGLISRIADAAKCQRSHVSRVIAGQLHFTPDQAFRVARFFQLTDSAFVYFLKLVEFGRSGDGDYRALLGRELNQLKRAHEDLSKRLNEPSLGSSERELVYYSNWIWSAIHILVSIPNFQTVSAIAQRLSLNPQLVQVCLSRLQEFGLVRLERNRWFIASGGLHLSKGSPLLAMKHSNWRDRAVLASQMPRNDGIHYTVVQSISQSDFERIKGLLLRAIDDYAAIAKPSKEEELVNFNCDFYRV